MVEKSKISVYQEQKKTKPKIEDIIYDLLKGNRKQDALDFVAYVKSLKMTPQWASANSWAVSYKNKRVCYIKVGNDSWYIRPSVSYDSSYENFISSENLEEVVWKNIHFCRRCGKCAPGKHETILGRAFDNVCYSIQLELHNPDATALNCAKKLVVFRRNVISINT